MASAESAAAPAAAPKASNRARPIKILPTDRIQFPKHLDILRAYAAASGPNGKPVSNREVSEIVNMVESTVSISNAFFTDTSLMVKTVSGFVPSQDVVNYLRAYEWNPETAAHKLAPTLRSTWFGEKIHTRLRFQPMDEAAAIQILAEEAAATRDYQKQVATLIDYLAAAGIVTRDNGVLRLGPTAGAAPAESTSHDADAAAPAVTAPRSSAVATSFASPSAGVISFHISVKVDMNEFAGWPADRITAFFGGIAAMLAAKGRIEEDAAS